MLLIAVLSFNSCYYDKKEEVYPLNNACDTTSVTYGKDILAIYSAECYKCHGTTSATDGAGFKLDTYTAAASLAAQSLSQVQSGFMPKGGTLSACNIAKIRTWVKNGAPNN